MLRKVERLTRRCAQGGRCKVAQEKQGRAAGAGAVDRQRAHLIRDGQDRVACRRDRVVGPRGPARLLLSGAGPQGARVQPDLAPLQDQADLEDAASLHAQQEGGRSRRAARWTARHGRRDRRGAACQRPRNDTRGDARDRRPGWKHWRVGWDRKAATGQPSCPARVHGTRRNKPRPRSGRVTREALPRACDTSEL